MIKSLLFLFNLVIGNSPVLKHGPRSITNKRVKKDNLTLNLHNESESVNILL